MAFVHLQTHSEFSILQASARLDDILAAAAAENAPAVALTDHGAMFGILEIQTRGKELNKKRKEQGLPPVKTVYGCHIYVDTPSASQKDPTTFERLTLLVENEKGYYNLLRIVSYRYEDGERWAEIPSVPLETINEFKEGIIAIAGDYFSRYGQNVASGRDSLAFEYMDRLNEIFDLIPSELNSKNKRFILKKLNENAKSKKFNNSFLWLKNAGVALPVYVAEEPQIPLVISRATNLFKLFMSDVGLLASQYADGIQKKIIEHQIDINFGAIYENMVAQELASHCFALYYYNNKKFGELDFLVECDDKVIPVEVKSGKDYYRHKAMNNLIGNKEYSLRDGYVFCNGNTEKKGSVTYLPVYMVMFLKKKELDKDSVYKVDFSDLNKFVSENKDKYGRITYGKSKKTN